MTDALFDRTDGLPMLEVRAFRHGRLIHQERCESEEQALLIVDAWSDIEDVTCEIVDLLPRRSEDGTGTELLERGEDDYPEAAELERDGRDLTRLEG